MIVVVGVFFGIVGLVVDFGLVWGFGWLFWEWWIVYV